MLDIEISRRNLLVGGACLMATSLLPNVALASQTAPARMLKFYNPNTGERVSAYYWEKGRYLADGLDEFNWLFRDYRADDAKMAIDHRLFDQLFELQRRLGNQREIHVICGYRSAQTNAHLRNKSRGVAKKSLHMQGQAVDINIPGVPLSMLRKGAVSLKAGGVGYYPRSNFVHIDTGPRRQW
ncbi:DUF882 domain-containing protein [Pseudaeromonas sharmana]|uniref:Murein endopeptidase K n=1 Tax=Pseudaeromonas sharmana TaxID=328412 RepID=A0ABV8CSA3_9GAMM